MRTAYVEILETEPGRAIVKWRSLVSGATLDVRFDAPCALARRDGPSDERLPQGQAEHSFVVDCGATLAGATIHVGGLGPILSEAVVWITRADGTSTSHFLTVSSPAWQLPYADSVWVVAKQYLRLGIEHIFTGADHLLFLLALVLCLRRPRAVLLAETAFTLSHSLSFSAAALGWVHVSSSAAEACIALSLVLVALDIPVGGGDRAPLAHGPLLAFTFGLVHGLGFAGGLSEIGLPDHAIPTALASFGAGIEIGQVVFLGAALGITSVLERTTFHPLAQRVGAYAVGSVGFFWLVERVGVCFKLGS
jgi:hypothetical protein